MNDAPAKSSFTKILRSDYITLLALLFPLVLVGMYAVTQYFGYIPGIGRHSALTREDSPFFLQLALLAAVIGLPLVAWRVRSIRSVFSRGVETPGQVTNISFRRDRGRVEYRYTYLDQEYQGSHSVQKNNQTKALSPGSEIVVIVDREKPERSLIRDLYA